MTCSRLRAAERGSRVFEDRSSSPIFGGKPSPASTQPREALPLPFSRQRPSTLATLPAKCTPSPVPHFSTSIFLAPFGGGPALGDEKFLPQATPWLPPPSFQSFSRPATPSTIRNKSSTSNWNFRSYGRSSHVPSEAVQIFIFRFDPGQLFPVNKLRE